MNLEVATIQDCIDMYRMKGKITVINDGQVVDFITEDINITPCHGRR